MDYLSDTHAVLWHFYDRPRLGRAARAAFTACDAGEVQIGLPAVVVAEMLMVVERGRLRGVTMPHLLAQLGQIQASANYQLLPLLPEAVIASQTLTAIAEIFDRLVVAEARQHDTPLITRDPDIRGSGYVRTIWDWGGRSRRARSTSPRWPGAAAATRRSTRW